MWDFKMADNATSAGDSLLDNQSYALQVAIMTILTIFSIFGTLGNGLVLYVFTKKNENVSTLISNNDILHAKSDLTSFHPNLFTIWNF